MKPRQPFRASLSERGNGANSSRLQVKAWEMWAEIFFDETSATSPGRGFFS